MLRGVSSKIKHYVTEDVIGCDALTVSDPRKCRRSYDGPLSEAYESDPYDKRTGTTGWT